LVDDLNRADIVPHHALVANRAVVISCDPDQKHLRLLTPSLFLSNAESLEGRSFTSGTGWMNF